MTLRQLSILLLFLLPNGARADVYRVAPDGSGDFATVQDAIMCAIDGDVIELGRGVFAGPGNAGIDFGGRSVTVRSQTGNPSDCTIRVAEGQFGFRFASADGPGSVLKGISLVGGAIGIICNGGAPTLERCSIRRCAQWGMRVEQGAPTLTECEVIANGIDGAGGGIAVWEGSGSFRRCRFEANGNALVAGDGAEVSATESLFRANMGGIEARGAAWLTISACTLYGNHSEGAASDVYVEGGATATIENSILAFGVGSQSVACEGGMVSLACSDLFGHTGEDWPACIASQLGRNGNIRIDPLFVDAEGGDFTLQAASACRPFSSPNASCDRIGWEALFDPFVPVVPVTWGTLKMRFHR